MNNNTEIADKIQEFVSEENLEIVSKVAEKDAAGLDCYATNGPLHLKQLNEIKEKLEQLVVDAGYKNSHEAAVFINRPPNQEGLFDHQIIFIGILPN